MKSYDLNTEFTFGKHKGRNLVSIAMDDPGYINWCCINLEHFYIDEQNLELLAGAAVKFMLSMDAKTILEIKKEKVRRMNAFRDRPVYDDVEYTFEQSSTYERYSGSYAQEVEGYSDEDIDDIFDGDPSAYWNID